MKATNRVFAKRVKDAATLWQQVRREDPVLQLRTHMRAMNLKSADIAERLGVSEANVSRWLRGNQNLTIDTLYSLADAIGATLTISFGEAKENKNHANDSKSEFWQSESIACRVYDLTAIRELRAASRKPLFPVKGGAYARVAASS
jgi:transcriptional regulator with XRE-family HTH domain